MHAWARARAHTHTHTHTHYEHFFHMQSMAIIYVWTANPRPLYPTTQSKCLFNYSALAKASWLVLEVKGHMRDLSQSYGRTMWGFSFWIPFVYLYCYFIKFSVLLSFSQPQLRTAVAPYTKRVPDFPIFRHSFTSTHTHTESLIEDWKLAKLVDWLTVFSPEYIFSSIASIHQRTSSQTVRKGTGRPISGLRKRKHAQSKRLPSKTEATSLLSVFVRKDVGIRLRSHDSVASFPTHLDSWHSRLALVGQYGASKDVTLWSNCTSESFVPSCRKKTNKQTQNRK